jgi:hypothetical protein
MNKENEDKYRFTYEYGGSEEYAPVKVTFEIPADVTIHQLLHQIGHFLKASGFYIDGELEVVNYLNSYKSIGKNNDCIYEEL